MSNQIYVDPGAGPDKIPVKTRTDSAGIDWPVSLLGFGSANNEMIVDATNRLPVALANGHGLATDAVSQAIRDRLPATLSSGRLAVDVAGSDIDIRNLTYLFDSMLAYLGAGDNVIGRVKLTDGSRIGAFRTAGSTDLLNIAVCDASGNQITNFAGGGSATQYTEGDVDSTITGTAVMWEDASDTLRAVSASKPLPIDLKNASIAVTGTFWQTAQPVIGYLETVAANFSRPADTASYAVGDLIANSTTAGSVAPLSLSVARVSAGSGMIRRARLKKSGTSSTNAYFRAHLYASNPTCTNGDNGAWLTTQSNYLGSIDVTCERVFSDACEGLGVPNSGSEISFKLSSGQAIYALLEARGAYAPVSGETFTLELEVYQN